VRVLELEVRHSRVVVNLRVVTLTKSREHSCTNFEATILNGCK